MGFSRAELESFRNATVPDLVEPDCRLLFVGINPGLWTAAVGAHFARRGNRFYPALLRAGIIEHAIDPSAGMAAADRDHLVERGVGITNLVHRATARADELTKPELRAGLIELEATVARVAPRVVAVLGISAYRSVAYRSAFEGPAGGVGRQPEAFAGAQLWVLPNPSGLNAHESVESLATAYRAAAIEAGVVPA